MVVAGAITATSTVQAIPVSGPCQLVINNGAAAIQLGAAGGSWTAGGFPVAINGVTPALNLQAGDVIYVYCATSSVVSYIAIKPS